MIVKIKTRKTPSYRQILEYLLKNKEERSFLLKHNLKGNSIPEWEKQFKANETYRKFKRKDSVLLYHEIISFHKDDVKNISPEKLEDLTREYIKLRNPNGIFLAVMHTDKEHHHIHLCTSALEFRNGNSLRMSKEKFAELKKQIQNYQREKYPELSNSIVAHGKTEKKELALSDTEYQIKRRTGRASEKERLVGILKTCYKKADCKESFFELLKECGLKIYSRGGKVSGVWFANRKFRFNRIGFGEERMDELEKVRIKGKELSDMRGERKKGIERNI